jgi:transposase
MRTKKPKGRPQTLGRAEIAKLDKISRHNKRATLQEVTNVFASSTRHLSTRAVRGYLQRLGRFAHPAKRKPLLSLAHVRARRRWIRETTHRDVNSFMFTDEAQMVACPKKAIWVRCLRSERYQPECLAARFAKEHGFHVWGAIWHGGRSPLVKLDLSQSKSKRGGFNSQLYIEQVLRPVLKPCYDRLRRQWKGYGEPVAMEDNSRVRNSAASSAERRRLGIKTIYHPPNSPDLNPIEHVWAALKRAIRSRPERARSEDELWAAVQEEWEKIDQSFIDRCIDSMYERRRALQKARGWSTRW